MSASTAPVPETLEGLRRQNSAYRTLCASLEAMQATQTERGRKYLEAINSLDSEREANAFLTRENEALVDALRKLRVTSVLLLNHGEACAINHYGGDYQGVMPGWLADCRKDVLDATQTLERHS